MQKDAEALREAAGGGAHLAFDMVGGAKDPNSTLAALGALYRGGRLVLMGSSAAPIPINYTQVMFNNLEIIGNFMHAQNDYLPLLALVRSGQLDLSPSGQGCSRWLILNRPWRPPGARGASN